MKIKYFILFAIIILISCTPNPKGIVTRKNIIPMHYDTIRTTTTINKMNIDLLEFVKVDTAWYITLKRNNIEKEYEVDKSQYNKAVIGKYTRISPKIKK